MLMTTASARRRASSTRRRCPSCRKPIVGTSATRRRAPRCSLTQRRRSGTVVSSFKAVLRPRVAAVPYLRAVRAHGVSNRFAQLGEALQELRIEALVEAEHVVQHEHLAIAPGSGPDADGGNGRCRGGAPGQLARE